MRTLDQVSELEWKCIKYFESISEPVDEEYVLSSDHVLDEHVDGYLSKDDKGKYCYADLNTYDEDVELINKFVNAVNDDKSGYSYNSEIFKNVIIKALSKFGL